jgi:molybdate transport system permease protein
MDDKLNSSNRSRKKWDRLFWLTMSGFGLLYLGLIVAMIAADFRFASLDDIHATLADPNVRFSIGLSLITCTISAILSMWVAIPTGYVLARLGRETIQQRLGDRPGMRRLVTGVRYLIDTLLDIPIVLPPLVVGISLLVLFQTSAGRWLDQGVGDLFASLGFTGIRGVTYEIPAVILAQFTVAAAFAVRTMRDTFEQIDARPEQVALTLGASQFQSFSRVAMPQATRGSVAAFTLAWARSLGEFGPILVFAGTARMKTEVLSTTVYLNFQFGNLRGAVAASLILLSVAIIVLMLTRLLMLGSRRGGAIA